MAASEPRAVPSASDLASADAATRAALLTAANINPNTGLATDYLNHFNEAVMLLEMIPDMPECSEDFLGWHPLSYAEHFKASNFKARDLAIAAYDTADPGIRSDFDDITTNMTTILTAIGEAMRGARQDAIDGGQRDVSLLLLQEVGGDGAAQQDPEATAGVAPGDDWQGRQHPEHRAARQRGCQEASLHRSAGPAGLSRSTRVRDA